MIKQNSTYIQYFEIKYNLLCFYIKVNIKIQTKISVVLSKYTMTFERLWVWTEENEWKNFYSKSKIIFLLAKTEKSN